MSGRLPRIACAMFVSSFALLGCEPERNHLVARTDDDVPAEWTRPEVAGSRFRPLMYDAGCWANGGKTFEYAWKKWERTDLSVFADCAVSYRGRQSKGFRRIVPGGEWPFLKDYARWDTGAVIRTGITLKDFFGECESWRAMEEQARPDRPFFVSCVASRPAFFLEKSYDTDRASFAGWRSRHPGFQGFIALSEFDSDSWYYNWKARLLEDKSLQDRLVSAYPLPKDAYGWTNLVGEAWNRTSALLFGDRDFWPMCSGYYSYCHIFARFGAKGLLYEATGQGCPRWQVSGAFVRGAARQFSLPFIWYQAHFLSTYARGKWDKIVCGDNRWGQKPDPFGGPHVGISRSLFGRQSAYGWLIGSSFSMIEDWANLFSEPNGAGKRRPNDFAYDYDEIYGLSKRIDRGVSYTPVALLVPLCDRYNCWGATENAPDNLSQNSFYLTLVPIGGMINQKDLHRKGVEGGFFNSPYADFWDVLTPDSGQDSRRFAVALSAYKAAFLVGSYRKGDLDVAALRRYVEGGGTLFVSADQIVDGHVPAALAGLSVSADAVNSGRSLSMPDGRVVPLENSYGWMTAAAVTARPLVTDDLGTAVVYANDVGRGRVLTVCARRMRPTPELDVQAVARGEARYDLIANLLTAVQDDTLPVAVSGDVSWGVNRTSSGWLLWLFNNKGITHYSGEAPIVDPAAKAEVSVAFKTLPKRVADVRTGAGLDASKTMRLVVEPGAWRILEVVE